MYVHCLPEFNSCVTLLSAMLSPTIHRSTERGRGGLCNMVYRGQADAKESEKCFLTSRFVPAINTNLWKKKHLIHVVQCTQTCVSPTTIECTHNTQLTEYVDWLAGFVWELVESADDACAFFLQHSLEAFTMTQTVWASGLGWYSLTGDRRGVPFARLVFATTHFHDSGFLGCFLGFQGVTSLDPLVELTLPAERRVRATVTSMHSLLGPGII